MVEYISSAQQLKINTNIVQCSSQDNVVSDGSLENDGLSPEGGSGDVDHYEVMSGFNLLCVIYLLRNFRTWLCEVHVIASCYTTNQSSGRYIMD